MTSGSSIPARLLTAGCAMLLVCGSSSAETKSPSAAPKASSPTVSAHSSAHKGKKSRKSAKRKRGQQKIDSTRAREIQEALIREHYLDGPATGNWDAKSQSAIQRYQADNGWQSKSVPDSRALIKLGLGPDHEHLLNPESAMTSRPEPLHPTPVSNQAPAMGTTQPQR